MRFYLYLTIAFVIVVLFGLCVGVPYSQEVWQYNASIDTNDQIYDGDTLKDVVIRVSDYTQQGEVWPGVFVQEDGVYVQTDIRIYGIDTPEKRPSTKNKDGTLRTQVSRDAEKAASLKARQALIDLIESHYHTFSIEEPAHGKYAGRIVAKVRVGEIDVATYLIDKGLAKAYKGGTKPQWSWK